MEVLRLFGYGLLAGVLLLAPAFPATSLVREKIKGTLALLLNSPMRPASIYLGKLGGVLGFTAVLLAMTLPAAAACYALGGDGARAASPSCTSSSASRPCRPPRSDCWSAAAPIPPTAPSASPTPSSWASCVAAADPVRAAPRRVRSVTRLASWLRCLSPIPAVMEVLGQGDVGSFGMSAGGGAVVRYVLLALAGSAACAWATVARAQPQLLDRRGRPGS